MEKAKTADLRTNSEFLPITLIVLVFFAVLYFFSPSVRGSDQYWYVGDIERVVLQDGAYATNSVFPNSLPSDLKELPRPWVQNKPVSYIVLQIAWLTKNGHLAWLIFNTLCLVASALMVARCLQLRRKLWFIALFLFFPFNFYLASQPLTDMFILFLVAAIQYLLVAAKRNNLTVILLALATAVLIAQRPNYLLLLIVVPIAFYFLWPRKKLLSTGVFLVVTMALVYVNSLVIKEHLLIRPTIIDTIVNNMPGKTNMGNYLYPYHAANLSVSELASVLWTKFCGAVINQLEFFGISSLMFYLVNLMLVGLVIIIAKRRWRTPAIAVSMVFIAIHFATVILFANQYRYAAAIIPALFIVDGEALRTLNFRIDLKWLRPAVIAFCLLLTSVIGYQVRRTAISEKDLNARVAELAKQKNITALMCEWNNGGCLSVGYALSPRPVFYFPRDYSVANWMAAAKKIHTNFGIVYYKSHLYNELQPFIVNEERVKGADIILFEIGPQGPTQ
ncbi:MAG: hypothetical protein EOO51_08580 [Flavobacterium sp.]|nr:MAG: hypothetical protein EOO51_08580 [Flavobacterium sp.]